MGTQPTVFTHTTDNPEKRRSNAQGSNVFEDQPEIVGQYSETGHNHALQNPNMLVIRDHMHTPTSDRRYFQGLKDTAREGWNIQKRGLPWLAGQCIVQEDNLSARR